MVNRLRKWLKNMSLKGCIFCTVIVLSLTSFGVYYFSFDSQAHVLACTGNYYLTNHQIYNLAGMSHQSRMWLVPSTIYENRISHMPLIESVQVTKTSNGRLITHVKEKVVVGYYTKKNKKYFLTIDNESIPIDKEYENIIVHFPLLNGFTAKQRKQIVSIFKKNKKVLTRAIIEKIAEMVPYKTSFDKNMIKMIMQDGNVVYTSISSMVMMAKYQAMLTRLQGENVCLLLDQSNSAIEKINCDELNGKKKNSSTKKTTKKTKTDTTQDTQTTDQTQSDQTENTQTSQNTYTTDTTQTTEDSSGLQYDQSSGYYIDPSTGTYYVWDDASQSLQPLSE